MKRRPRAGVSPERSAAPDPRRPGVLLDTGVLVALYARDDAHHADAADWMANFEGALHTVEAVLTEASFFLPVRTRAAVSELAASGRVTVHHPDAGGYVRIAQLFTKYADRSPDWAEMALVWLAEAAGISRIATLDVADFGVYRINGRKRFELELLR